MGVSVGLQMGGVFVALVGLVGVLLALATPTWRVTAFIGNNIITSQVMWEGLWMSCVVQSTGQMQCKVYDSMLDLDQDLQGARALTVVSVLVGGAGVLLAFAGGQCTNFIPEEGPKARATLGAGALLLVSGVLVLVPVSWTASIVIRDFYDPALLDAQKRELGASLYLGWGAGALLLLGGALLCTSCPPKEDQDQDRDRDQDQEQPSVKYLLNKMESAGSKSPNKTYI